jgi:hypothetical protein
MKKYYLITEKCRDGDFEYYDHIPVATTTPQDKWDDNWQNLFLCWQYSCTYIDSDGLWSDDRLVSVDGIKEITLDEYGILGGVMSGTFRLDEILKEGRERWVENELQEQLERINENS